ncbi:MAG: hypothetical protein QOF01_2020 [Thermomicrobiales bacterium]|nr:hypothetical protein [Thermomicrobiales bacterium]
MALTSQTIQLLRIIARHRPELWDLIHPHEPVLAGRSRLGALGRLAQVALNPQPLPPGEELVAAARYTARAVAEAAITAHATGQDARRMLFEVVDDWCPPRPTPKIPWPKKWPIPWPPGEPYPIDPELVVPSMQAEAGLVFQAFAYGIADEELSASLSEVSDRLIDAALQVQNTAS